jgi:Flp pilus assembly protein TadD
VSNSSGGRGGDRGARRGASSSGRRGQPPAAARRGAPASGRRSAAPAGQRKRSSRDPADLPRLGPDDEWPYAKARERGGRRSEPSTDRAGSARRSEPRTDRAGSARRSEPRTDRAGSSRRSEPRTDRAGSARRSEPRTDRGGSTRRGGAANRRDSRPEPDDRAARRRKGEVTGPFTRRRRPDAPTEPERPALRLKGPDRASTGRRAASTAAPAKGRSRRARSVPTDASPAAAPRKRRRTTEATEELRRLAGRQSDGALDALTRASDTFARGRERDALRILRPLVDTYPRAAAVRELAGLCRYRLGTYAAAADDLQAFVDLTGSTEQHPVLMDCRRAQGKLRAVEELWEELRESSPSAALVTEGRIVYAGALADAGRMSDAIDLLARRSSSTSRPKEHTVRLWYALADLYDRTGDLPRARALFEQVRRFDAEFADVAERLATLS